MIFILFIIIFKNFYGSATRRSFAEELHSFKKLQNSSKDVVTLYHGSTKTAWHTAATWHGNNTIATQVSDNCAP